MVSQVGGIWGQIVALLSSLSTKLNQLPEENKNNQTSFRDVCNKKKREMWELFPNRTFLDMNPYLVRHVGIVDAPSDIHLIILSASSSTKPSLDGTQSSSVEESPLPPLSQTQSIAFLLLHLSPRRPSHTAFSCPSPPLDPVFCLLDPIFCFFVS